MSHYTQCKKCKGRCHKQAKTGLCWECWLKDVRRKSPYISGELVPSGSQYKRYGKTHYERNKEKYKKGVSQRRTRNLDFIREYKRKHKCVDCNEGDFRVLDFDHIKGKKFKNISQMATEGYSIKSLKREISKCEVVCASCHRIRTWERAVINNAAIS